MVENLILVGAGASYGAGNVDPHQPPLGKDLFDKLKSEMPDPWGDLPGDIQCALEKDFENGMCKIGEKDSKNSPNYINPWGDILPNSN